MVSTSCQGCRTFALGILALSLLRSANAKRTPPDVAHFKHVLSACKLQAPVPSKEEKNLTTSFSNKYFYMDKEHMTFKAKGRNKRSELRQYKEWRTDTKTVMRMNATLKLGTFLTSSMQGYTFMQIHGGEAPLLRVALIDEKDGRTDYLWAVVRSGLSDDDVENYPLVPRPNGDFKCDISVYKNELQVFIKGRNVLRVNVSSWEKYSNYFKAGGTQKCAKPPKAFLLFSLANMFLPLLCPMHFYSLHSTRKRQCRCAF